MLAFKARVHRRERRANNAMQVICQFMETESKDAGWVEDKNQEVFNDVIKRELTEAKGVLGGLGIEEEWTDEIENLNQVLERIDALEASFARAKQSLSVLKKKAKKAKRVASQIVEMSYPEQEEWITIII